MDGESKSGYYLPAAPVHSFAVGLVLMSIGSISAALWAAVELRSMADKLDGLPAGELVVERHRNRVIKDEEQDRRLARLETEVFYTSTQKPEAAVACIPGWPERPGDPVPTLRYVLRFPVVQPHG